MSDIRTILAQVINWFSSLPLPRTGLNILDYVIVAVFAFYAYEGYALGFLLATADLISFILSFVIALKGYGMLGGFLSSAFAIPPGFANAIGFFVVALVSEIALNILLRRGVKFLPKLAVSERSKEILASLNKTGGIIPGIISAIVILSFIFTVIISLPTSPFLKSSITDSMIGSRLITQTAVLEKTLNNVFGGALYETLNFLTVEPDSGESVALNFTVASPIVDNASEEKMLELVNKEREKAGVGPLVMDRELVILARDYSTDMLHRGYFSHYNPEGQSPFDRMDEYAIDYVAAGENLAFAPSVELAMQGLMDSPGHKANILSPEFGRIGIGVMDGGVYGKMFTQEFTN